MDTDAVADEAPRHARVLPYLLLSLAVLAWAGNWVIGRAMRHDMGPVAMCFWRWLLALTILLPLCWRELLGKRQVVRREWLRLMLMGATGAMAFNTMLYVGLQFTEASNATLFNSTSPIYIVVLSWLVFGERVSLRQAVGIALSLAGVLAIVSRGDATALLRLQVNVGDLWIIVAMFLWAVYTTLLRWRPAELSASAFLAAMLLLSLPLMLPFYFWEWWLRGGFDLTPATLATLAYFGIVPSVLAYLMWNRGVAEVGANRAGLIVHLLPIFTVALSMLFLGERISSYHFVGAAFVFSGIWLTATPSRSAA